MGQRIVKIGGKKAKVWTKPMISKTWIPCMLLPLYGHNQIILAYIIKWQPSLQPPLYTTDIIQGGIPEYVDKRCIILSVFTIKSYKMLKSKLFFSTAVNEFSKLIFFLVKDKEFM